MTDTKITLREADIPTHFYNIVPALPTPPLGQRRREQLDDSSQLDRTRVSRAHLTNHSRRRARVFDRLAALRSLRRSSRYGSVARLASRPNPRAGLGPDL